MRVSKSEFGGTFDPVLRTIPLLPQGDNPLAWH